MNRRVQRAIALPLLLLLVFAMPLPELSPDGSPRYRITTGTAALAFDEEEGGAWNSEPMEVEATTVGISWEEGQNPEGTAWVRSSPDGGSWSDWVALELDDDHAPDPWTEEAQQARPASEPVFIGDDEVVQFRVEAAAAPRMQVELIDARARGRSMSDRLPTMELPRADADGTRPDIVTREDWGADQCTTQATDVADEAKVMFVHHTVNPNGYSAERARELVFNICLYHVRTRGWKDIGYNFLVDAYGAIYEGRSGGMDRAVIGAQVGGYNTGSIGVAFLGTHEDQAPTAAAQNALVELATWKMDVHGIDPLGLSTLNGRTLQNVSGHRDAGSTSCPGEAGYQILDDVRARIAADALNLTDIDDSRHRRDIITIARAEITRGCNPPANDRFCPIDFVTREQMAAFLVRALGLTAESGIRFQDVPRGSVFERDIDRLATAGITRGCNPPANDLFCPSEQVTREQMAAFLVRGWNLPEASPAIGFTDVPSSDVFASDINRLATAGITRGCNPPDNSRYCPQQNVTREQMASFISRALP